MKLYHFILACGLAVTTSMPAFSQTKQEQPTSKEASTARLVDAKNYTFVAQTALPMRGRTINLTSEYTLEVSQDTITAFLPYYGRAYSAPLDPSKGGIKFTSTQFTYDRKAGKRGGWNISITPSDVRSTQKLSLSITDDGYASLQVISNNRQPISFNGHIRKNED